MIPVVASLSAFRFSSFEPPTATQAANIVNYSFRDTLIRCTLFSGTTTVKTTTAVKTLSAYLSIINRVIKMKSTFETPIVSHPSGTRSAIQIDINELLTCRLILFNFSNSEGWEWDGEHQSSRFG